MGNEISIGCEGTIYLDYKTITEFQGDIKKISKQNIEKLKNSIKEKFKAPFFVWKNKNKYFMLDGHQRKKALSELENEGYKIPELPAVEVFANTKDEAKQIVLELTSQHGEFDKKALELYINQYNISPVNLVLRNVEIKLKTVINTKNDDEFEEKVETITKLGDLWELGRHRLLCGDSTKQEDYVKLMNGKLADLYLSDPPYNVDYTGKTKDALKIKNDKKSDSDFREFLKIVFENIFNVLKPGACFYVWHADSEGYNFRGAIHDIGEKVRQCLIWNKNTMVMGRQDFQWKHEPCLYGWKEGAAHLWASDRKQTTILNFDRPTKSTEHPTMKPVALFEYQIQNNTKGQDLVVDNFLGSGTTIIAAEKTNRICYGLELDPHYCDVIVNRYKKWCEDNEREVNIKRNGKQIKWQ